MYVEFAAVVHSLNHITTLLKSAHSVSNYNELVAAVSEVSSKLMAAQAVALGLPRETGVSRQRAS